MPIDERDLDGDFEHEQLPRYLTGGRYSEFREHYSENIPIKRIALIWPRWSYIINRGDEKIAYTMYISDANTTGNFLIVDHLRKGRQTNQELLHDPLNPELEDYSVYSTEAWEGVFENSRSSDGLGNGEIELDVGRAIRIPKKFDSAETISSH